MRGFLHVVSAMTLLVFVIAPATILPQLSRLGETLSFNMATPLWAGLAGLGIIAVAIMYVLAYPLRHTSD